MPSHPQFKEVLNEQIQDFQKRAGIDMNEISEQLAKATAKEVSVIRSYRSGLRFPPDPALRANREIPLPANKAEAFFRKAEGITGISVRRLAASAFCAAKSSCASSRPNTMAAAASSTGSLWRFLDAAGIRHGPHDNEHLDFYSLREQLWNANSRLDAALGVLCTPICPRLSPNRACSNTENGTPLCQNAVPDTCHPFTTVPSPLFRTLNGN